MRLTTFSDYSLRVLMYLGVHSERLATIGDIAEAYDISENHVMKVVHHLAQQGYIETSRGKGGGMRLARRPEKINIGEVVLGTEENLKLVECFDKSTSNCHIAPACMLKGILRRAMDEFFAVLDRHTLADLLVSRPKLARILVLSTAGLRRGQAQSKRTRRVGGALPAK
jgi:Rrf2 family nitric oxide-sensitive transcriptional repressor